MHCDHQFIKRSTMNNELLDVQLLDKVRNLFMDSATFSTDALADVYASDIVFVDPVHRVEGLDALKAYFDRSYSNVISCRFEFVGEVLQGNTATLKWVMHVSHRKLSAGRPISLPGVSWVQTSAKEPNKVAYHEDFYDLGALVYEQVPLLNRIVRHIKAGMSGDLGGKVSGDLNRKRRGK